MKGGDEMSEYPTNDPVKVCVRCIYSVYINDRWLCVKNGTTVKVRDYCEKFKRRVDKDETQKNDR